MTFFHFHGVESSPESIMARLQVDRLEIGQGNRIDEFISAVDKVDCWKTMGDRPARQWLTRSYVRLNVTVDVMSESGEMCIRAYFDAIDRWQTNNPYRRPSNNYCAMDDQMCNVFDGMDSNLIK